MNDEEGEADSLESLLKGLGSRPGGPGLVGRTASSDQGGPGVSRG